MLVPFLNPFYTYRVVKSYVLIFVVPTSADGTLSRKKRAEHEKEEEDDEEEDDETEEPQGTAEEGEQTAGSAENLPKVEVVKKKRGRRRNNRD